MRTKRLFIIMVVAVLITFAMQPVSAIAGEIQSNANLLKYAGNSISTATDIPFNGTITGEINSLNTADYYRLSLHASGCVTITAKAVMRYISYSIFDVSGNEVWSSEAWSDETIGLSSFLKSIDLTKGIYYLRLQRWAANGWTSSGTYSMSLAFSSAGESFTETGNGTNNSIFSADSIYLNRDYKGQLAVNDGQDFYKFILDAPESVLLNSNASMRYINYYIYDSSYKRVWSRDAWSDEVTGICTTSESINLNKGIYFLIIERWNANGWISSGNYSLKLSTHIHNYSNIITKATTTKNGKIVKKCSCGDIGGSTIIYYPKTIRLSETKYSYDRRAKKPIVNVKGSDGKTISSSNYSVSYSRGRKNVGTYIVKIIFNGNYSGAASKSFVINPKSISISKLTARSKGFSVKWKKQSSQVTGYQLQYSMSKKFSNKTTKTISNRLTSSCSYRKLKAKKKYYVRIRSYKKVNGKLFYSSWSSVKSISTKK